MSMPNEPALDNCGCCQPAASPPKLYNRPGLPALAYRSGTYATFFRSMLYRIGTFTLPDGEFADSRPLASLTTRAQNDASIALMDASSIMADVLTFYQERIANEGFLRTATERRSILELARAIGYELNPGVAASVYLAFTVEDAAGAPGVATVPSGTRVKSIPPQGQLPQTFETSTDITVYKEWNALHPRLSRPQNLTTGINQLYLSGTGSNLNKGDLILITAASDYAVRHVVDTPAIDPVNQITTVTLDAPVNPLGGVLGSLYASLLDEHIPFTAEAVQALVMQKASQDASLSNFLQARQWDVQELLNHLAPFHSADPGWNPGLIAPLLDQKIPFTATTIQEQILQKSWEDASLNAFLQANDWNAQALMDYLAQYHGEYPGVTGSAYAMRTRLGIFGNNAPRYDSLPASQTAGEWITPSDSSGNPGTPYFVQGAYPQPWEGRNITTNSQGGSLNSVSFYLERSVPAVCPGSLVVLEQEGVSSGAYRVSSVLDASLADYGISAKVTGLTVSDAFKAPALGKFLVRNTTAYVQSETLNLSEIPDTDVLEKGTTSLQLDSFVFGLQVGQAVLLSGERADADGQTQTEALVIESITHNYGLTTLVFETGLTFPYTRSTVTINANVAIATHGETVNETLGSGDGTQANQAFTLKKPPLTYTPAATPSGSASTLQVRVNNLLWDQAASLYGLDAQDQDYIIRIDNDSNATVLFGDGAMGTRLPTGLNNVTAVYRSGIGLNGEVGALSLTLLPTRPLGVRSVTNPLPASGAADPEKMENARSNAPLTVRTLDRIVSLDDYEDFARAFAGIGKAQAIDLWCDEHRLVYLTIAGADGQMVSDAKFLANFQSAMDGVRDPAQMIRVGTFTQLLFNLVASLAVDSRYVVADVFTAVQNALVGAFSFAERSFSQLVTAAEVTTVIQQVAGVVYVNLTSLYFSRDSQALNQILPAGIAHVQNSTVQNAELLLINPFGITLQEVPA